MTSNTEKSRSKHSNPSKPSKRSRHSNPSKPSKRSRHRRSPSKRRSRKSKYIKSVKYPNICEKIKVNKWIEPIYKNFKSHYKKTKKSICLSKKKRFENRTYKKEHVDLLQKEIPGIKIGDPNLIQLYKTFSERKAYNYNIPKPNNSKNKQIVLGPSEYLLPYYINTKRRNKYSILNMMETGRFKWSPKFNQEYVSCALHSYLTGSKKYGKYPIRLVLPTNIKKVMKHKSYFGRKLSERVTAGELCAIEQIMNTTTATGESLKIKDVTPTDRVRDEPYVYLITK
jgi:hypothetical protein